MNQDELKHLLQSYFDNTISKNDGVKLLAYINASDSNEIAGIIDEAMLRLDEGPEFKSVNRKEVLNRIKLDPQFLQQHSAIDISRTNIFRFCINSWLRAAIVIFLFGAGIILYLAVRKDRSYQPIMAQTNRKICPGSKQATLALSNGRVIGLDTVTNGLIAITGKARAFISHKAQLVYTITPAQTSSPGKISSPVYSVLSTPRGGEFQVTLSDGTKVWLNSASSLKFPNEFGKRERRVTLTGEAYFEVAKNKEKPFLVEMNNTEVMVLGTHFNIAAYTDDQTITTTLLEGAVKVRSSDKSSVIKPGEQAVVVNNTNAIMVSPANIEKAMAWRNGYFLFGDEDIHSIMKKISRWYDVDVEYRDNLSDVRFGGTSNRTKSINELLSYMEEVGKIHFKIEGRRVIVMK